MRCFHFILLCTLISLTLSRATDNVRTVSARDGDNISFDFDVQGASVKWYLGKAKLSSNSKYDISRSGSLSINGLSKWDTGRYKAMVELGANTAELVFVLDVLGFEEVEAVEQEEYIEHDETQEEIAEELEEDDEDVGGSDPLIRKLSMASVKIKHNADFYNECYDLNTNYPGNDLTTVSAHSLSHCQLLCLEYGDCTAFVYIARCVDMGVVKQCVLKGGSVATMSKQTKQGFTAATLACLVAQDGRCYKEGYTVSAELPALQTATRLTHIQCQEKCMALVECRAFSYNPLNGKCVHEKQAAIGHTWSDTKEIYTEKSCIRATDRSCFTEGYEYTSELISTVEAHTMSQCIWRCVEEPECRVFVFIELGNGRMNSCMLKKQSTDTLMQEFKGAVMGDMACLESKGEQGYYLNKKVHDQQPFDHVTAYGREECERRCNEHTECKAFTLHQSTCTRYNVVPSRLEPADGHITGFKDCLQMAAGGRKTHISCSYTAQSNAMSCPIGQFLSIEHAMYGRDSRYICMNLEGVAVQKSVLEGPTGATCKGDVVGVTNQVKAWCQGKRECVFDLKAGSDQFNKLSTEMGITCVNTGLKYLKVEYKCSMTNVGVKTTCAGGEVSLSCGKPRKSLRIKKAAWGRPTNSICRKDKSEWCGTGIQMDYRGTMSRTVSGLECQRWDVFKPHKHKHFVKKQFDSLDENYCRNPDPEAGGAGDGKGNPGKAWCFTVDPNVRVENCPVPMCDQVPCLGSMSATTQKVAQLCEGEQSCKFTASSTIFQDPCPHIPKYLELSYSCTVGQSTGDYDRTLPLLDVAQVQGVVRVLDQLPTDEASECYLQNIDYEGDVIRENENVHSLKECLNLASAYEEGNLIVYMVQKKKCCIKRVSAFIEKDVAGVISAQVECLDNESMARKKRSAPKQQPDSEILDYKEYLKKTTIGYKPQALFNNKIPRKQVVDNAMRERESDYTFISPNNANFKHSEDLKMDVIDNGGE